MERLERFEKALSDIESKQLVENCLFLCYYII